MESTGIEISEVRRQLSRYEPLLLMVLSIHGVFVLLLVTGGMPRHWLGLGVMLLLGMMAWRYPQISLRIRVTLFVLLTWFLLFSSGGVGSFFLLWYFVTVAFYPLLFNRPVNLIVAAVVPLSYVLLLPFSGSQIPIFVVLARAFLMFFIGWVVSVLGDRLVDYGWQWQKSEENLQRILGASPYAMIIARLADGRYLDVNEHFQRLTGYDRDDIVGQISGEVDFWAYPDERAIYLKMIQQQGEAHNFEMTLRRKSGEMGTAIINSEIVELNGDDCLVMFAYDVTEWRKTEEQTTYQANLLGNVSDAIISTDEKFNIKSWNRAAESLYGWRVDEVMGRQIGDVLLTEYLEFDEETVAKQFFETGHWQGEVIQTDQSGMKWNVFSAVSLITDSQNRPTGAVAVNRNITANKQLMAALRQREDQYQAVVEGQMELISRHLPDTTISFVNEAYCRYFGYRRDELMGKKLDAVLSASIVDVVRQKFARLTVEQPVETDEHLERQADGRMRWLQWTDQAIFNERGELVEIQSVGRDITYLKEIQNQLLSIINSVPEGVVLLDDQSCVRLTNPIAEQYLAILEPEWENGRLQQLGDQPLSELLTSPPQGFWHEIEMNGRYFEAIARPVEYSLRDSDWVLVLRDVTEERYTQRRVQEQERLSAVGKLAAGIAHDFNNILAVITLYTQMTLQTVDMPHRSQERLQIVEQQAHRATDLIQQILDFSRQSVLTKRPLDMQSFLAEIVRLLHRTLSEAIKLTFAYDKELAPIYADASRMQQVIVNLAVNARDAMLDGGDLLIRLTQLEIRNEDTPPLPDLHLGSWVVVEITDNGTGIDAHVRSRIFEPFFTTKEIGKGTGLGLSQVYGIVQQHNGFLDVKSEVGQGTTFLLYFPAYWADTIEPLPNSSGLQQGRQQTVLLVEDNEVARQALVDALHFLNYQVIEVYNGRDALTLLKDKSGQIDLILSDVVMPEMGGIALFQTLRQQGSAIPLILMSGHPMGQELAVLQAEGLAGWLPKPPNIEVLANLVFESMTK